MQDQSNPYDPPATSSPRARRSAMTARFVKAFGIVTFVGFLVWELGFIYGVFFVGVPYSVAPPDLLQRQEVQLNVSEYIGERYIR